MSVDQKKIEKLPRRNRNAVNGVWKSLKKSHFLQYLSAAKLKVFEISRLMFLFWFAKVYPVNSWHLPKVKTRSQCCEMGQMRLLWWFSNFMRRGILKGEPRHHLLILWFFSGSHLCHRFSWCSSAWYSSHGRTMSAGSTMHKARIGFVRPQRPIRGWTVLPVPHHYSRGYHSLRWENFSLV